MKTEKDPTENSEPLIHQMSPEERKSAFIEHLENSGIMESLNVSIGVDDRKRSKCDIKLIIIITLLLIIFSLGAFFIGRSTSNNSQNPKTKRVVYDENGKKKLAMITSGKAPSSIRMETNILENLKTTLNMGMVSLPGMTVQNTMVNLLKAKEKGKVIFT